MSIEIDIHNCVSIETERGESGSTAWITYKFTDVKGNVIEVTAFDPQPLNATLLQFVKHTSKLERERFETSNATGA